MPPVLSVESVRKSFGGVAAVNDVSLALEPRRIYGLIGRSGGGKTPLFTCSSGTERVDAGRVSFRGERIDGLKPWQVARRGIGRTFQIIRVFPELTALENLLVVTRGARAEAERRGRELLEFVRLGDLAGEYAGNLSYGQQKLVEFVRMLMTEPTLILLDEPAAGVNRTLLNDLLDAVSRLRDAGKTVLLVEHGLKVGMGLCAMTQPGPSLVHLAVLRTLGGSDLAWRVFALAWLLATACVIAALAAPWGALAAGSGALVFATYHLAGGAWQAGQRDFLLCLFLLLGALGVARWLERGRLASLVWSGAALGAGITVKPHVALFAGALAAVVAVAAARACGVPTASGVTAVFVAATAAAPLAVLGWLAAARGPPPPYPDASGHLVPPYPPARPPSS